MKAMVVHAPAGLDNLRLEERADPGAPGAGEIRVALHGGSLNYHDLGVVTGRMGAADGLVPLADGAGVVEAVGEGVMGLIGPQFVGGTGALAFLLAAEAVAATAVVSEAALIYVARSPGRHELAGNHHRHRADRRGADLGR